MFTRQHYKSIGYIVGITSLATKTKDTYETVLINKLCHYFKQDNSRFNEARFRNFIEQTKTQEAH